jgi:hypothetical protein
MFKAWLLVFLQQKAKNSLEAPDSKQRAAARSRLTDYDVPAALAMAGTRASVSLSFLRKIRRPTNGAYSR